MGRLNVNYSKYVKRSKHRTVEDGEIYEKDHFVLTGNELVKGDSSYGSDNFRFVTNKTDNLKLEYKSGDWVKPDDSKDYWTFDDLDEVNNITDSSIEIKPNYGNLRDFCYYGSCQESVRVGINNIIEGYPGELYVSGNRVPGLFGGKVVDGVYYENTIKDPLDDNKEKYSSDFFYVNNEFNIDLFTEIGETKSIGVDDADYLKYFSVSHYDYTFSKDVDGVECAKFWNSDYNVLYSTDEKLCNNNKGMLVKIVDLMNDDCGERYLIYIVYYNGEYIYLYNGNNTNMHIRPQNYFIKKYFDKQTDIERLLLNPNTNPRYSINIYAPVETNEGILNKRINLRFPTFNNWNLDLTSKNFTTFYNRLLDIAHFLDEHYTDNLWKHMVHDSIKNKDNTYVNEETDEDSNDYVLGVGKMEKVIRVFAAFFDEIKRKIDNIKTANTVTYNGNSNTPDYFLSDVNELSGWDITDPVKTLKYSYTSDNIFKEESGLFNAADAKNRFLRYLKLNSRQIFSRKGTKEGIEMVMGLFGLKSYDYMKMLSDGEGLFDYDYKIDEYICVADGFNTDIETVLRLNKKKYWYDPSGSDTQGLMVATVYTKGYSYLIPWFDKNVSYDGNVYYQMNGGWCLDKTKGSDLDSVYEPNEYGYDENINYLVKLNSLLDLKKLTEDNLYSGLIVKIADKSTITRENMLNVFDNLSPDDEIKIIDDGDISQYLVLDEPEYSTLYNNRNVDYEGGWEIISQLEIDSNSGNGKRVNHLEGIVTTNFGNAPHVGYGQYDDGREYLEYFDNIFKHTVDGRYFDTDLYDCDGELDSGINHIGFTGIFKEDGSVNYKKDNRRVWCFSDEQDISAESYDGTTFEYDFKPVDFEDKKCENFNESSANSIVNTKKIVLTFNVLNNEDREFINGSVLPYVKQMIPSGVLLEIVFDNGLLVGAYTQKEPMVAGVTNDSVSNFEEYLNCEIVCEEEEQ